MLVICPRCGFEQPKDQFCAKCGVDMVAFERPKGSLSSKLINSPIFQLGVLLVIVIFAIHSIQGFRKERVEREVEKLKVAEVRKTIPLRTTPRKASSNKIAKSPEPAIVEPTNPAVTQTIEDQLLETDLPAPQLVGLQVSFYEVPTEKVAQIIERARTRGPLFSEGDLVLASIPKVEAQELSTLLRFESKMTKTLDQIDFIHRLPNSRLEYGYRFSIAKTETPFEIDFEIQRVVPVVLDNRLSLRPRFFQERITFSQDYQIIGTGLGSSFNSDPLAIYPESLAGALSILNRANFLSGQVELIILLTPSFK